MIYSDLSFHFRDFKGSTEGLFMLAYFTIIHYGLQRYTSRCVKSSICYVENESNSRNKDLNLIPVYCRRIWIQSTEGLSDIVHVLNSHLKEHLSAKSQTLKLPLLSI